MSSNIRSIKELADITFNLIPEEIQKKYEENVFENILTLKDQFIAYCYHYWKFPKYSKEETEKIIKDVIIPRIDITKKLEISIFDELLFQFGTLEESKEDI